METKTQKLTIRTTPAQLQNLKAVAAESNMNVSQFVRSFADTPKQQNAA
jgi:uncharacterized protein (DUF1778 family)